MSSSPGWPRGGICSQCGHGFASERGGDSHRRGAHYCTNRECALPHRSKDRNVRKPDGTMTPYWHDHRHCLTPAEMAAGGMWQGPNGIWHDSYSPTRRERRPNRRWDTDSECAMSSLSDFRR